MDKLELMELYDRLCDILTYYESAREDKRPDHNPGDALYNDLAQIVDDLASKIN
jgi:hypothetical protein